MVSMTPKDFFTVTVATVPPGSVVDSPPTYPADVPGIVSVVAAADGLSCVVTAAAVGSCVVTPTAVAGGHTVTGAPIQITVSPPPPVFATSLTVNIGPVQPHP
jgi:hypothetical protein